MSLFASFSGPTSVGATDSVSMKYRSILSRSFSASNGTSALRANQSPASVTFCPACGLATSSTRTLSRTPITL